MPSDAAAHFRRRRTARHRLASRSLPTRISSRPSPSFLPVSAEEAGWAPPKERGARRVTPLLALASSSSRSSSPNSRDFLEIAGRPPQHRTGARRSHADCRSSSGVGPGGGRVPDQDRLGPRALQHACRSTTCPAGEPEASALVNIRAHHRWGRIHRVRARPPSCRSRLRRRCDGRPAPAGARRTSSVDLPPSVRLFTGDVTHAPDWDAVLRLFRPSQIVHLAAETGTAQSLSRRRATAR